MTVEVAHHGGRSSPNGYVRGVALACALLGLIGWLWWRGFFVSGYDVDARVTFVGPGTRELRSLRLIAGADKAHWPALRAGESVRTTLFTEGEDTSITVQFVIHEEQLSWQGPTLAPGTGYRIAIQIDSSGRVAEEHCLLPCQLR